MTIDFFGGGRVEAIFVYGWFLVKIQGRIELNFVHGWVFNHRVSLGIGYFISGFQKIEISLLKIRVYCR